MRSIYTKDELVRKVRALKSIRRKYDVVNLRCQNELSNHGFELYEFVNPEFEPSKEKEIKVWNCEYKGNKYGVLISFGMDPQAINHRNLKSRFYALKIEIPDFYAPLTPEQEIEIERIKKAQKELKIIITAKNKTIEKSDNSIILNPYRTDKEYIKSNYYDTYFNSGIFTKKVESSNSSGKKLIIKKSGRGGVVDRPTLNNTETPIEAPRIVRYEYDDFDNDWLFNTDDVVPPENGDDF